MRALLLTIAASIAAIAVPIAPAEADPRRGDELRGRAPATAVGDFRCHDRGRDRRGHGDRRRRDTSCDVFVPGWYGGEWALYNNRSWEPGSYNDWWHDRPDRAYPRWVQDARNSGTCAPDRMWWSGRGWHC